MRKNVLYYKMLNYAHYKNPCKEAFYLKYWRGYLIALILGAFSWALTQFAAAHSRLMDMIYPYVTRVVQTSLAEWSGSVNYCVWQALLLFGILLLLASVVLMVALRWNPVQWFGWVLAVVMLANLVGTTLYGLNDQTGSIAEDVRFENTEFTVNSLEEATTYYLGKANELSGMVFRDKNGIMKKQSFADQAVQAADGFHNLVYVQHYAVFAGSTLPVKKLEWSGYYTGRGITGKTVGYTGEAAVNPQVPAMGMPFAMCKEMSKRMSISRDSDANFAAYMACVANSDSAFQYSGYLMAFRFCYNALKAENSSAGRAALRRVENQISPKVAADLKVYNRFVDSNAVSKGTVSLLVNWHIETVILPIQQEQEQANKVIIFDPLDEEDPRLKDMLEPAK